MHVRPNESDFTRPQAMEHCLLYSNPEFCAFLFPTSDDLTTVCKEEPRERRCASERFYVEEPGLEKAAR